MDKAQENHLNYYLNAVSYINASALLGNAYTKEGLDNPTHQHYQIQVWPMQYMLSLCAEMTLKAGLVMNGFELKDLTGRNTGHNLEWLSQQYVEKIEELDFLLSDQIKALNKGEFRYTEFFGDKETYIAPVNPSVFLAGIKDVLEKDHKLALEQVKMSKINPEGTTK